MPLNAQILLSILSHESTSGDISQTLRVTPATYSLALGNGTGANQAQVAWSDARTIAAAGSSTIDLAAAADDRGVVVFSAIKLIYVRNTGANEIAWSGGGWGGGPFDDISASPFTIQPDAAFLLASPTAAGYSVGGGGGQTIVFSSTLGATYDIILIGEGTIT